MTAQKSSFSTIRRGLFWAGVVMVILGAAALIMPLVSSLVVAIFIGWLLAFSGLLSIIGAVALRGTQLFAWQIVAGLVTLVAGFYLLVFPAQALVALTLLVALVLVLTGAAQAAFAIWMRPMPSWVWALLSAMVSVALGVFILATLPEASAVVLGLFVGVDFLSTGVALVLISRSVSQVPRA